MASELAKAGDLQKTSNDIKCKTISKRGEEQMEEYNRSLVYRPLTWAPCAY